MGAARGRSRAFPRRERRTHVPLAQLPRVPCAVTVGAAAERTEAGGGELCRTRPRLRICIRRVGRRTHKSPALHSIPRRPKGGVREADALAGVSTVAPTVTARWKANQHSSSHEQPNSTRSVTKKVYQTFSQRLPFLLERSAASTKRIVRTPSCAPGKSCGLRSLTAAQNSR